MQNYVLVVDTTGQPLSPCHPAKARKLLRQGKAAIIRRYPFTIVLKYAVEDAGPVACEVKLDPGAKTTGIALVQHNRSGPAVVWAAEIAHQGMVVKQKLNTRRAQRRARRSRKTRYRPPRFNNRRRPAGWLPPSLMSRVQNVQTWTRRLCRLAPVRAITVERVRFDTQLMENPDIQGVEYQQGTLWGYEVKEYLLERDRRRCAYCHAKDIPLQIEHIVPRSRGGHHRVTNLTLACPHCNQEKGNQTAAEYGYPDIQRLVTQRSLRGVAAVNATRNKVVEVLAGLGVSVRTGTGGQTKYNRAQNGYPKAHWIDAACAGPQGVAVQLDPAMQVLQIKAAGRQSRQMTKPDRYGFPRTSPKGNRYVHGFATGDMVRAVVPPGRKTSGTHTGRVAIRSSGAFRVGTVDGVHWRFCTLLHRADGYEYAKGEGASSPQQATGFPRPY